MSRVSSLVTRVAPAAALVLAFASSSPAQTGRVTQAEQLDTQARVGERCAQPVDSRVGDVVAAGDDADVDRHDLAQRSSRIMAEEPTSTNLV